MSYSNSTRTVMDVARSVKRTFGDESGVQIEDADILMWVNDAQDEIVNRNKILKGTSTVASVIGQQDYTFPTVPIHQIESLHYAGRAIPNLPFSKAEEQLLDSNTQSGEPAFWYEWGGKFSLFPVPATVKNIAIYYTMRPTKVTAQSDLLSVPDKYYQAVVAFVLQKAYAMDEDWNAQQAMAQQFDTSTNEMGEEERNPANMTYALITMADEY